MSELRILLTLADPATAPSGNAANNIARFLTLLIIFILVLGVTFYTTKFIARTQQGRVNSANMEIMETMPVANGKYLQIVRISGKYVVLAIAKDSITKVTELAEGEYVPSEKPQAGSFGDLLKKFAKPAGDADTDPSAKTDKGEGNGHQ